MPELETQMADLKAQLDAVQGRMPENKLSMICFSGDLDKVLAAFVIRRPAAACLRLHEGLHEIKRGVAG